eukprot:2586190-Pleurochrysis_carterae.AAC.1
MWAKYSRCCAPAGFGSSRRRIRARAARHARYSTERLAAKNGASALSMSSLNMCSMASLKR